MTRIVFVAALLTLSSAAPLAAISGEPTPLPSRSWARGGMMSAFGRAVAIAGDYAFVGEPNNVAGRGGAAAASLPGVVHVYRRGPTGWKKVADLGAPAGARGEAFGTALATDGTTLLVSQLATAPGGGGRGRAGGAAGAATPPPADTTQGAVYLFTRAANGTWSSAGTLDGPGAPGARFGSSLLIKGDLALVGATGSGTGGAVYLFRRSADGRWTAAGTLPVQGLAEGDRFGASLALEESRVAVGAPGHEQKGAVYLFRRGGNGEWSAEGQVASRRLPDNAQLGSAVALKGNRVIAGAPTAMFGAAPAAGQGGGRGGAPAVPGVTVVFEGNANNQWREVGSLTPFDMGNSGFGTSVAVVGDEIWIGAPTSEGMGKIYRARQDRFGNWTSMAKLDVDSVDANSQFGATFAVSADAAIVGMPGDGGGAGTVAFLGRAATGAWTLRGTTFPPVPGAYAAVSGKEVRCGDDGKAAAFDCSNTGLMSFLPLSAMGGKRGVRIGGMWGWTDSLTGRDYAMVGRNDGTAFVDVTDPLHPRYLGDLMRTAGSTSSVWREIKTYKNHAYIVSDGSGDHHGIQIFDLTRLRTIKTPQRFSEDAHYDIGAIHNIWINTETGYAYAVGTSSGGETCGGGSHIIDIREPRKPKFVTCFADEQTGRRNTGYTHDTQCVNYKGPDARYAGHEVCLSANETHMSIHDVTDKKNPKVISRVTYPSVAYAHQATFSADHRFMYQNDELDEGGFTGTTGAGGNGPNCPCGKAAEGTRTLVWDMTDLADPVLVKEFIGTTHATDHNEYVKGNRLYQSNYRAGLRILDITDPKNPREVGYLDTYPADNAKEGGGSWSNYPFFKNGMIGVVSATEGLFIVKDRTATTVP